MAEEGTSERIIKINIEEEMKSAYIDYSMSVIVSRALPDVRDGMKPVHRRILYDMSNELNLYSDKPHRKSARIVGDVLGKFHPHGDSSVYEAMVRMAQEWSMRYMLVDGQGNFGSVDGDGPAAMRYTEARMKKIADEVMADIEKDTVEFRPNFDETIPEPTVLPTKIPLLLVNGASGIAVGMATNMPPHNLSDTIDAICAYIDDPNIEVADLIKHIKAPDFPTGGSRYVPSSLSGVSGYSNRSNAISFRFSGRLSKPAFCLIYSISPSCFTAAATVLLIFAVSQFTFRLTEFLISFKIRTFSRFISATCASMIFNISTIWAPSFKYTT